jgi:AcrR family transcriptional regulator
VVDAALAIVDESGAEALTIARVAERTGVAAPSLYKHVTGGLLALRRLVKLRVLAEFGEVLRTAALGRAGADALRALGTAYRDYLRAHPYRHPFVETAPDDPETSAAAQRVVAVVAAALQGYGLTGSTAIHAIRCLRSAIHGFARLEAIGGFGLPEEVDTTFAHLLDMITEWVSAMATTKARPAGSRL